MFSAKMRRPKQQCLSHILSLRTASLKTAALAVLLVSPFVFAAGFTLDDSAGDRDAYGSAAEDADQSADYARLGDIKVGGAAQQQLLSQLKNELGTEAADVSMLERNHGANEDESAVLRNAVAGINEDFEDDGEHDSVSEEEDESASGSAQEDSASFLENAEADDADIDDEEDSDFEDTDGADSWLSEEQDQDSGSAQADGSGSFVEEDDSVSDEPGSSDAYHDEEEVHLADPYGAPAFSVVPGDHDHGELDYEEEPSSFVQVGETEMLIKKHAHRSRHLAHDTPGSAFNQDHARLRLADQTPVEDELLNEASDTEGGRGVVSPMDFGSPEGDGEIEPDASATEGDSGSADNDGAPPMEGNMEETIELRREQSPEQASRGGDVPPLRENETVAGVAEDNGESLLSKERERATGVLERTPGRFNVGMQETATVRAPEAETVEGTAAQIVEEMSKQDQGVEESRPQQVLKRHTWQDMETQQDLRVKGGPAAKRSSQTLTAAPPISLVALLVGGHLLFRA